MNTLQIEFAIGLGVFLILIFFTLMKMVDTLGDISKTLDDVKVIMKHEAHKNQTEEEYCKIEGCYWEQGI